MTAEHVLLDCPQFIELWKETRQMPVDHVESVRRRRVLKQTAKFIKQSDISVLVVYAEEEEVPPK
jgi:hypothetical protein